MHTERFTLDPGLTLYAFPLSGTLANWTASRVACTESGAGRYSVTVNPAIDSTWLVFIGATAPGDFDDWVLQFETDPVPSGNGGGETPPPATPTDIEAAAAEPASASVDGQSTTNRSIAELIAADRYAADKRAAAAKRPGIRIFKLKNGSAVGE